MPQLPMLLGTYYNSTPASLQGHVIISLFRNFPATTTA